MPKKLKIGTQSFGSPDSRDGLGYGVLKPSGRFEPRQSGNSFPYREKEEIDIVSSKLEAMNIEDLAKILAEARKTKHFNLTGIRTRGGN